MSKVLFKRVDYKLDNLIMDIESGKLGLPDIQRPFVWPATKVRELLDSMLRGVNGKLNSIVFGKKMYHSHNLYQERRGI